MTTSDPARRAALFLHAMHESDRGWVLAHLAPAERDNAKVLLEELAALGIPGDAGLLDSYVDTDGSPQAAAPALSHEMAVELLFRVEAGELVALLKGEPDLLVARVLLLHAWPWKRDFLIRIGQPRARRIEGWMARAEAVGQAPLMTTMLLQTVTDNLREQRRRAHVAPVLITGKPRWTHWYTPLLGRLAALGRYRRSQ